MEGSSSNLDYLPESLSNTLMMFQPITVFSPRRPKYKEVAFDTKIKHVPQNHHLEKSFRPYFRASKHVNAIKNIYNKYFTKEFDASIEGHNRFLHDSPKNNGFKSSRKPDYDSFLRNGKNLQKHSQSLNTRKSTMSRFPPINEEVYKRFDIHLSYLSISNTKMHLLR